MRLLVCNCPPGVGVTLARTVVEEGLAACVNIVPGVLSVYRWDGAIQEDQECTLLLKVASGGVAALRERLVVLHPYDVPEVLVLEVDVGESHTPYVDWVRATTAMER